MTSLRLPLRIGLLLDHPSPHMVALLDALAERTDCVAKVVYCDKTAPGRSWGAPVGKLPHSFTQGITLPGKLRLNPGITQALTSVKADIWVVNSCYTSPSTLLAAWWLTSSAIPWVYVNEPPQPRNLVVGGLRKPLLSFVLERASAVIGMGRHAQAIYNSALKHPKPSASVPYYIELNGLYDLPLPEPPSVGQPVRFVSSGQMIKRKGFDILLKACELLPPDGWSLTLAGDGPLRHTLEEEFSSRWNSNRIVFVGQVPYEKRASVFAGQHAFVFPSRWDGWGMVVPEALAAGLPVIATDQVISAHEFVRDGLNGFLVPASDPAALADRMAFFIEHPDSIPVMGASGRDALKEYTPAVGVEKLVNVLSEVFTRHESAKKRVNQSESSSLTWAGLIHHHGSVDRMRKRTRQASKTAICQAAVILQAKPKPAGHRILAYHLVLPEDRNRFEEHVRFFKDHFIMSTVSEVFAASRNGNTGQYRLAITFDDGFGILRQDCLEILEKHGIKGCFLVPTAFAEARHDPELAVAFCLRKHHYTMPLEPLGPEDLKFLTNLGHEVGSHGVFHIGLGMVTEHMARKVLTTSRAQIAEWTGKKPVTYAYPYGDVTSSVGQPSSWVEEAGYSFGLSLRRGKVTATSNPFSLPREHAEGNWSLHDLRYFLSRD
jgi:glycosyltransferase involved in cell wall biosynthesis/peptidoglycan/xylan/chitin deacetylase (PgdA/CDA1 family)